MKRAIVALAAGLVLAYAAAGAAEERGPAPQQRAAAGERPAPARGEPGAAGPAEGIAARYPGDAGIASDPRVLLHEDFEADAPAAPGGPAAPGPRFDKAKWTNISNKAGALAFSDDVPPGSRGKRSLLVTARLGENTGGHLFRRFQPGLERMHARFYVKFAPDCDYIHHFVHIVAENPPHPWPTGGAGELPAGDKKFSTGLEPWGKWGKFPPPGAWNFYSYWWKMKRAPDGKYWGNSFLPEEPAAPERGRWYAVEMMLQANTPGKADGRQAFWIDGRPAGDFGGIEWRASADLRINAFWLMSYVTEHSAKTNKVNRVWFDDVVVATAYIGPRAAAAERGTAGSPRRISPAADLSGRGG